MTLPRHPRLPAVGRRKRKFIFSLVKHRFPPPDQASAQASRER